MKRSQISTRRRFEIFKRDNFACQYCGGHPPDVVLEIDHIEAVANGGSTEEHNLVTACRGCNSGKSAVPLESIPQSLRDKAAEIEEAEAQLRGYYAVIEAQRARIEAEQWRVIRIIEPAAETFPMSAFRSVGKFIERLGLYAVIGAAEIAAAKQIHQSRRFRYFCGICWTKIRATGEPILSEERDEMMEKAYSYRRQA